MLGAIDLERCLGEIQRRENGIENVATEITERAVSKILPVAPTPWVVNAVASVSTLRRNAKPEIPIERLGDGRPTLRSGDVA